MSIKPFSVVSRDSKVSISKDNQMMGQYLNLKTIYQRNVKSNKHSAYADITQIKSKR